MTLRDSHNRCVTCGRPPSEECCDTCHAVAARLKAEPLWVRRGHEPERIRFWDLPQPVNTEAVNQ